MRVATCIVEMNCKLGEGCVWDAIEECLYFVDIEGCKIHNYYPNTYQVATYACSDTVSCIVPNHAGGIVAAIGTKLFQIDSFGQQPIFLLELGLSPTIRCNDGKCDKEGRLWIGTMARELQHPLAKPVGQLYCIRKDHVVGTYSGYRIPNGMAWNTEGMLFYHIDTATQRIDSYKMDEAG